MRAFENSMIPDVFVDEDLIGQEIMRDRFRLCDFTLTASDFPPYNDMSEQHAFM